MTICLDKELLKQFKKVAQKEVRKYSNMWKVVFVDMCKVRFNLSL